jgi:tRNA modification GTPase
VVSGTPRRLDPSDTIVALASPAGPGLRAVVRLSGPSTAYILKSLAPAFSADAPAARRYVRAQARFPELHSALPLDVWFWPAPATYTGQDLAQIHLVSSMPLVQLVLTRCQQAGARPAGPGEFTLRAFLAGKLDLTRAEAVLGVIEANTAEELREALTQLAGGLAQPLKLLHEDLLNLLADVEAGLDFTEEDIRFVEPTEMLGRLAKALAQVTLVQRQLASRSLGHRPFRIVLAGPPNAGKSSLFNALTGSRALVSAEPGTTRDFLEAPLPASDTPMTLVDTAGQYESAEAIEGAAQRLGAEQSRRADLTLWCSAPDAAADPGDAIPRDRVLCVHTKSDLPSAPPTDLAVSVRTGAGLDELRRELQARARLHAGSPLAASLSRSRAHLEACLEHLRGAHRLVLEKDPPELLALELRLALEELGAIVGEVYTDDLLDRIFSRFCIGK